MVNIEAILVYCYFQEPESIMAPGIKRIPITVFLLLSKPQQKVFHEQQPKHLVLVASGIEM